MCDESYMAMALKLAEKGRGAVNPNPMVGCVIVKDGRVIGYGYHEKYGGAHAEINALDSCCEPSDGATLYITLEPCCHQGKTPPCTEAIIRSSAARVVIGSQDPNPLVSGGGAAVLRKNKIEVDVGVLERECTELNEVYFHYIRAKRPFVIMKYAMTADGKIAAKTGASQWITGKAARRRVHGDRGRCGAVMIGVNTLIMDDPMLNCRLENGKNPLRVICDTELRTPLDSALVKTASEIPTAIATARENQKAHKDYTDRGCEIITVPKKDGHICLAALMSLLGDRGIDSVLLEGGGTLNWAALESGIVDRVQTYVAPKIFGGSAPSPVGGFGVNSPENAFILKNSRITRYGDDFLIESDVEYTSKTGQAEGVKNVYGDN